jgi:hypothetical protein
MRPARAALLGFGLLAAAQAVALFAAPRREAAGFAALPPGEFAGTLMLGGFRGLACDLLWLRADSAKQAGRFYESVALAEAITRVQPRFAEVWQHLAHDLAYNIAFEADGPEQRFAWFVAGARANARGVERNPGVERLLRHLAWMFYHRGDRFPEQVARTDFAPLLNPLLAEVARRTGQPVAELPAGAGRSHFAIAHALYSAAVVQAEYDQQVVGRQPSFVRRMAVHSLDGDGNLLRNRGEHLAAVRRWIEAGRAWTAVEAWLAAGGEDARASDTRDVLVRSEGRIRRKAADLAQRLAPDAAAGAAAAAAILDRRWDEAEALLARPGWRQAAASDARVRWLDGG